MTWPDDWDQRLRQDGCALCKEGRPERIPHGIRVYSGPVVDGYLSTRSAQPGYIVAIWRGRHVNDLTELSTDELTGYWGEITHISEAMQRHYRPRKMNYEVLGNQMPHLHTHISARFAEGDVAPGQPMRVDRNGDLPADLVARDVAALRELLSEPPER